MYKISTIFKLRLLNLKYFLKLSLIHEYERKESEISHCVDSRNLRVNTEHMTLSELSAPPLRGIDSQVIVERTNGGETQPFIR